MSERAGGRYALLNPGAAWPNKRWPPSRFAAVALRASRAARVVLGCVVGAGRARAGGGRRRGAGGAALLSPPTTIADLVAIARGAARHGVRRHRPDAHRARRSGTPIVGLYGPTRPSATGRGRRTTSRFRATHLRVPSSAPLQARDDVPARHSGGRGRGRRRAPASCRRERACLSHARRPSASRGCACALGFVVRRARALAARSRRATRSRGAACGRHGRRNAAHLGRGSSQQVARGDGFGSVSLVAHPLYIGSSIMGVGLAVACEQRRRGRDHRASISS